MGDCIAYLFFSGIENRFTGAFRNRRGGVRCLSSGYVSEIGCISSGEADELLQRVGGPEDFYASMAAAGVMVLLCMGLAALGFDRRQL